MVVAELAEAEASLVELLLAALVALAVVVTAEIMLEAVKTVSQTQVALAVAERVVRRVKLAATAAPAL